jgi:hypothetical protein
MGRYERWSGRQDRHRHSLHRGTIERGLNDRMRFQTALRILFALTLTTTAPRHTHAQPLTANVERQVVSARDSVWHAWFANDTALLTHLLPSALVAGGGAPITQWNDLTAELRESRAFASSGARLERLSFAHTRITLEGNVAMVAADYKLLIRSANALDSMTGHAVELFVRQGDRWVNPFWLLVRSRTAATGGARLRNDTSAPVRRRTPAAGGVQGLR